MQYATPLRFLTRSLFRQMPTPSPLPTVVDPELWRDSWFASSLDLADGIVVAEEGMSLEEFELWQSVGQVDPAVLN